MDTGKTQRTHISLTQGILFLLLSIVLSVAIIIVVFSFHNRVISDYMQRVTAVGTKFEVSEQLYVNARKEILNRKVLSKESIEELTLSYNSIKKEFTDLQKNIFIAKDNDNLISETLKAINTRLSQIPVLQSASNLINSENEIQTSLKAFDTCTEKIDYKNSNQVSQEINTCFVYTSNAAKISTDLETSGQLSCQKEEYPSIFIMNLVSSYQSLGQYYLSLSQKDYVNVDKFDKQYKDFRNTLSKAKPVSYCITKTLEETVKKL